MSLLRLTFSTVLCLAFLAGCSTVSDIFEDENQKPLPGERVSILELQRNLEPESAALTEQPFVAPTPWQNEYWPQAGGYPNHAMQHLSLPDGPLEKVWSADIGAGSTSKLPLTAQPIVAAGKVFAMDSEGTLSAFDNKTGKKLWNVNTKDANEDESVITGGIAFSQDKLFVTNGYDQVLCISASDGRLIWREKIPAASRAAPTISENRAFVTTLDNRLVALSTEDGQTLWSFSALSESAGLIGAASPAAGQNIVIPAFSSGEIMAVRVENGSVAWNENLSALRTAGGLSGISDIRALPVMDNGMVFAVSFGGRMMAIDQRTGTRLWHRDIGSAETPWITGNHLFMITSDSELVAISRSSGAIRWVMELPRYKDPDDRDGPVFWTGPIMAGHRLVIASTEGTVMEINPANGELIRSWKSGRSITISPVVAGDTLYLLGEDGTLMAYR